MVERGMGEERLDVRGAARRRLGGYGGGRSDEHESEISDHVGWRSRQELLSAPEGRRFMCSRGPTFFLQRWGPTPALLLGARAPRNGSGLPLALTRRPGFAGLPSGASLGPQALHYFMLVGPHPHSLSLGGPASPGFPPAPRSGRRRYIIFFCAARPTTSAKAENNRSE